MLKEMEKFLKGRAVNFREGSVHSITEVCLKGVCQAEPEIIDSGKEDRTQGVWNDVTNRSNESITRGKDTCLGSPVDGFRGKNISRVRVVICTASTAVMYRMRVSDECAFFSEEGGKVRSLLARAEEMTNKGTNFALFAELFHFGSERREVFTTFMTHSRMETMQGQGNSCEQDVEKPGSR